jgi:hypothetical protein
MLKLGNAFIADYVRATLIPINLKPNTRQAQASNVLHRGNVRVSKVASQQVVTASI